MIIEIKNLPQGRKVKHISVDISFEEDSAVVSTSVSEPVKMPVSEPSPPTQENREKKEVPPEMTDMEF